jgi:Polyketide cyclase / dehydrase and lipid transport
VQPTTYKPGPRPANPARSPTRYVGRVTDSRIVSVTTTVEAPAATVFAILADPREHARIDGSGSVRELVTGPDRLERGAEFGMDMKLFGLPYKIRNRVVEFEEGRLIAWRHFGGHRWRYELRPIPGGTRVTESFDYSPYNRVGAAVIRFAGFPERNRRGIEETLARLKAAAEQDADHESGD